MTDLWRQFQLFDLVPIRDPFFQTPDALYSDPSLSAVTSTRTYLVFAVQNCQVKIINKDIHLLRTFTAYEPDYKIHYMASVQGLDLLVTVAEKQGSPAILKLWDLRKLVEIPGQADADDQYQYATVVRINETTNNFPITSVDFSFDLSCVAIGYANGKVILVRGDLMRDRGSKQRVVYESSDPVTGVLFNQLNDILYVTTTSKVLTVLTNGRNNGRPHQIMLKRIGADVNCLAVQADLQELIVANSDAIKFYNTELLQFRSIAFDVEKRYIYPFGSNYLLVLSSQISSSAPNQSRLFVLDLYNKHVSMSVNFPNATIIKVFSLWGEIHAVSSDGILYQIHEKSINQQIEILSQRHLYDVASKLASQRKLPNSTLFDIHKRHGDHLCELGDWEAAIDLYIVCLELVDANDEGEIFADFVMDVITHFKDTLNLVNLTKFLFSLYSLKLADNDHLTLLLCCYCKLKKMEELDQFIAELQLDEDDTPNLKVKLSELNFLLIINLFKECGYFSQVIKLLQKLHQPRHIVDVQLNYLHQPKVCIDFISTLPVDEVLLVLVDYAKHLLDALPLEATNLLINVFTGRYVPYEQQGPLESVVKDSDVPSPSFPITSYRTFVAYFSSKETQVMNGIENSTKTLPLEPTYLPPKASLIFPLFINHPNEFVVFLEACVDTFDKFQGSTSDKTDLIMTLFEMYLTLGAQESHSDEEKASWNEKASNLVQNYMDLIDKSTLLLISHIYGFSEGEIFAKEQAGFEELLFRALAISGDVGECFHIARKYEKSNPGLYKLLLKFIVSTKEVYDQVSESDFKQVLDKVKTLKLASPLEIIQILSGTEFPTLGLIKEFLIEYIEAQDKEISNNQKLVESYEAESSMYGQKLSELEDEPFIILNNKCTACKLKLDFPVFHFKCQHSYHQRCLDENTILSVDGKNTQEHHCPICLGNLEQIRDVRMKQLQSKEDVTLFEQALKDKDDRFKVISDFIGKGVMEEDTATIV